MRQRVSSVLRVLSYLALAASVGGLTWIGSAPTSPGCQNAGCVGTGIGQGLAWLVAAIGLFALCAIVNIAAFFIQPAPRSLGRKIEAALFALPLVGGVAVLARL
jgi:hypothetical protein